MKALLVLPVLLAIYAVPPVATETPRGDHDWVVDPGHSSVVFKLKHANASWFYGNFEAISGDVSLDPAAPEKGSVKLSIPIESVHTRDEKRDAHLRGADFFNGKENPAITFASTTIAKKGDEVFAVTGLLSIAGTEKLVSIEVQKTGEGELYGRRQGYETKFVIKRSDYGMTYGLTPKEVLGDEVTVIVALEVIKPK